MVPPSPALPLAPARLPQQPRPRRASQPPAAAPGQPPATVLLVHLATQPAARTPAALDRLYTELSALDQRFSASHEGDRR